MNTLTVLSAVPADGASFVQLEERQVLIMSDGPVGVYGGVDDGTSPEMLEAVCVEASRAAVTAELREAGDPNQLGPSTDLTCLRQALACVAAHPNASDRAVRQAVRAGGKPAGREVLQRRADPELVRFVFEHTDVHPWDAVTDTASGSAPWAVNPALPSDKLDTLIGMSTNPGSPTAAEPRTHAFTPLCWPTRTSPAGSGHNSSGHRPSETADSSLSGRPPGRDRYRPALWLAPAGNRPGSTLSSSKQSRRDAKPKRQNS